MSEAPFTFATCYVALPTPFDAEGKVDFSKLEQITDYVLGQKPDGLALLTEAAEDPLLTGEERIEIVNVVAGAVKNKVPLAVAVSAASTREAVELVRAADKVGAAGFFVSPFRLPGLGYRALYRHTDRVANACDKAIYLEVRPGNAIDCLTPEEKATLSQHPRVTGVFAPQAPLDSLKFWARRFKKREGAAVISGCALTFEECARQGATAVVCGISLLGMRPAKALIAAVKRGDVDTLREIAKQSEPAIQMLAPPRATEDLEGVKKLATKLAQQPLAGAELLPSYPFSLLKAGLQLQGHAFEPRVRPPYEPASAERIGRLRAVLKQAGYLS